MGPATTPSAPCLPPPSMSARRRDRRRDVGTRDRSSDRPTPSGTHGEIGTTLHTEREIKSPASRAEPERTGDDDQYPPGISNGTGTPAGLADASRTTRRSQLTVFAQDRDGRTSSSTLAVRRGIRSIRRIGYEWQPRMGRSSLRTPARQRHRPDRRAGFGTTRLANDISFKRMIRWQMAAGFGHLLERVWYGFRWE